MPFGPSFVGVVGLLDASVVGDILTLRVHAVQLRQEDKMFILRSNVVNFVFSNSNLKETF